MAQMVEYLPSKHKALSSNPSATKKTKTTTKTKQVKIWHIKKNSSLQKNAN
jgi:hypothetical protein